MKIFIIGLLVLLFNYQSSTDREHVLNDKYIVAELVDTSSRLNIEYPLPVEYTNDANADTMFFCLGDDRLLITPNGDVVKNNELFFEIHPKGNIQKIFPFVIGDDLLVIYSYSTNKEESGSFAKRISLKLKDSIWEKSIYGFSPERPVLVNGFIYLSTIGYIGKLSVKTGEFIWEFDDFFKNGDFISFNEPLFYKDSVVLFTENNSPELIGCSILIDNRNSCVLNIKR